MVGEGHFGKDSFILCVFGLQEVRERCGRQSKGRHRKGQDEVSEYKEEGVLVCGLGCSNQFGLTFKGTCMKSFLRVHLLTILR